MKLEMGKRSHRICEINKRHKRAQGLLHSNRAIELTENLIPSETTTYVIYNVEKNNESCSCMVQCTECKIYAHMITHVPA